MPSPNGAVSAVIHPIFFHSCNTLLLLLGSQNTQFRLHVFPSLRSIYVGDSIVSLIYPHSSLARCL